VAPHFLEHRLHKLPVEVSRKILAFVRRQGLVFSALDFVLSAESEYCFLENNPNGQWLWLEMETGFDLSEKLIGLLLGEQKFQSPV
jgi:hypothetical protein